MQTFTLSFGSWLRRLTVRNPLVRTSDRIEAAAVLLIFVVALLAAPVAGSVARRSTTTSHIDSPQTGLPGTKSRRR